MEGDVINLPEVVKLARLHNARVMVDDAHSLGVLGATGAGTAEHFGLGPEVDIIMVTASKSLASIGGFLAAREEVIHYIKHFARALIFTASLPPAQVAAIDASLDVMQEEPERREILWKNTRKMKREFRALGFETHDSSTPIIPIYVGDDLKAFQMWRMLFDDGVFTSPVVSPAVPEGQAIIRTSYMALHTDRHLDHVLSAFEKAGKQLGIISGGTRASARKETTASKRIMKRLMVGTRQLRLGSKKWVKNLFWRFGGS